MSETFFFEKILKAGKVKFTNDVLENNILKEPNSNNFLGIISILSHYNIVCSPFFIEENSLPIDKLPFITHLNDPEEILFIEKCENDILHYYNNEGYFFKLKKNEFEKKWSKNVIFLEYSSKTEKNYFKNLLTEKSPIVLFLLFLIFSTSTIILKYTFPANLIYLVNNLIGLYVSYKLNIISISQNQDSSKICNLTKKSNCLNILNHKNSKLFGIISYDKIGYVYFIFALFLPSISECNELNSLFVIFCVSALFPIYSIYFQYFIVKNWCPLCLIIQINLIVNFLVFLILDLDFIYSVDLIIRTILLLTIIILGVFFYTKFSSSKNEYKQNRRRLNNFINDAEVLDVFMNRNVELISIPKSVCILTGNIDAINKITFITNPFCKYCSEMYNLLKEVLEYNKNIKIETIYCISDDLEIVNEVTKRLMDIYLTNGMDNYEKEVSDWYSKGYYNYKDWLGKFRNEIESPSKVYEMLSYHNEWCKLSKIDGTPTILLNNKVLPKVFIVDDLKYIL